MSRNYPFELPEVSVESARGLGQRQIQEMMQELQPKINVLIGSEMLYEIIELFKEFIKTIRKRVTFFDLREANQLKAHKLKAESQMEQANLERIQLDLKLQEEQRRLRSLILEDIQEKESRFKEKADKFKENTAQTDASQFSSASDQSDQEDEKRTSLEHQVFNDVKIQVFGRTWTTLTIGQKLYENNYVLYEGTLSTSFKGGKYMNGSKQSLLMKEIDIEKVKNPLEYYHDVRRLQEASNAKRLNSDFLIILDAPSRHRIYDSEKFYDFWLKATKRKSILLLARISLESVSLTKLIQFSGYSLSPLSLQTLLRNILIFFQQMTTMNVDTLISFLDLSLPEIYLDSHDLNQIILPHYYTLESYTSSVLDNSKNFCCEPMLFLMFDLVFHGQDTGQKHGCATGIDAKLKNLAPSSLQTLLKLFLQAPLSLQSPPTPFVISGDNQTRKKSILRIEIQLIKDALLSSYFTEVLSSKSEKCFIELPPPTPFLPSSVTTAVHCPRLNTDLIYDGHQRQQPPPPRRYSRYANDFEELEFLGEGGFGQVLKVRNRLDSRLYAIKRISLKFHGTLNHHDDYGDDNNSTKMDMDLMKALQNEQWSKKLLREVMALSRINNDFVVRYYNAWLEYQPKKSRQNNTKIICSSNSKNTEPSGASFIHFESNEDLSKKMDESTTEDADTVKAVSDDVSQDTFSSSDDDSCESLFVSKSEWTIGQYSDQEDNNSVSDTNSKSHSCKAPSFATLYIQMEYCPNKTLREYIDEGEQLGIEIPLASSLFTTQTKPSNLESCSGWTFVWKLFRQIVEGLYHIHGLGMIHRDLKPGNIFLDENEDAKIGDFGLVVTKDLERTNPDKNDQEKKNPGRKESNYFETSSFKTTINSNFKSSNRGSMISGGTLGIGTPIYIAPELLEQQESVADTLILKAGEAQVAATNLLTARYNSKVDMYSLGIVLFEMVHGKFTTGMERLSVLTKLRHNPPILPSSFESLRKYLDVHKEEVLNEQEDSYELISWRAFFWLLQVLLSHNKKERVSSKDLHVRYRHKIPEIKSDDSLVEWKNQLLRIIHKPNSAQFKQMVHMLLLEGKESASDWKESAISDSLVLDNYSFHYKCSMMTQFLPLFPVNLPTTFLSNILTCSGASLMSAWVPPSILFRIFQLNQNESYDSILDFFLHFILKEFILGGGGSTDTKLLDADGKVLIMARDPFISFALSYFRSSLELTTAATTTTVDTNGSLAHTESQSQIIIAPGVSSLLKLIHQKSFLNFKNAFGGHPNLFASSMLVAVQNKYSGYDDMLNEFLILTQSLYHLQLVRTTSSTPKSLPFYKIRISNGKWFRLFFNELLGFTELQLPLLAHTMTLLSSFATFKHLSWTNSFKKKLIKTLSTSSPGNSSPTTLSMSKVESIRQLLLIFAHRHDSWPAFFQALKYCIEHKIITNPTVSPAIFLKRIEDSIYNYLPVLAYFEDLYHVKFSWTPFLPHYYEYFDSGLVYDFTWTTTSCNNEPSDLPCLPFAYGGSLNSILFKMHRSCPSLNLQLSASACSFLPLDSFDFSYTQTKYSFSEVTLLFNTNILESTAEKIGIYTHLLHMNLAPTVLAFDSAQDDPTRLLNHPFLKDRVLFFVTITTGYIGHQHSNSSSISTNNHNISSLLMPNKRYLISFKYYTTVSTSLDFDVPLKDLLSNKKGLLSFIQNIVSIES